MIGNYEWWQWLMYFYVYSFAGWIWESAYVSIRKKKFVNRGFLHLPLLPLYGSGAVVVLFVTMPFADNIVLLYIAGMIGATFLEMITGLTMEALYKVKYWDYSKCFLNFRGVICLKASLLWGVFSVVMVKVAQTYVASCLAPLPVTGVLCGEAVVTVSFVCDLYESNRDALQLAHVLTAMEKAKEEMQEDLRRLEEEMAAQRSLLEEQLAQSRERAQEEIEAKITAAIARNEEARAAAAEAHQRMAASAELRIEETRARAAEIRRMPGHLLKEAELNALFNHEEAYAKLQECHERYLAHQDELLSRANRLSCSMLRRNPTARMSRQLELSDVLRRRAENLGSESPENTASIE